jgi:hypothetical protein
MDVDLDVLNPPVLHRISRHIYNRYVITINNRQFGGYLMEFLEKLTQLGTLGDSMGNGAILRLGARPVSCRLDDHEIKLSLRKMQNPEVERWVSGHNPVGIRVCSQCSGRRGINVQAKIDSSFEITEDVLDEIEVSGPGSMHEEASLLDGIREIRVCKHEILEGTYETTVEHGVSRGSPSETESLEPESTSVQTV